MMRAFCCGAVVALVLSAPAVAATPSYAVIDLGIQQSGEGLPWQGIVGTPASAFYPVPSGATGTLYASNSVATVGVVNQSGQEFDAALWTADSRGNLVFTNIGILPGGVGVGRPPSAIAYGVNKVGDVVGVTDTPYAANVSNAQSASHAFLWNSGTMRDLGSIAGNGYFSQAEGVNDSREIVGWTDTISSATGETLRRAFVYIDGTMFNLTFYLVDGPTVLLSDATAIDCQGNISAIGKPASGGSGWPHTYLLIRQGAKRTCAS